MLLTHLSSLHLNLFRAGDLPVEPLEVRQRDPTGITFVEQKVASQAFVTGQGGTDGRSGDFNQIIKLRPQEAGTPNRARQAVAVAR